MLTKILRILYLIDLSFNEISPLSFVLPGELKLLPKRSPNQKDSKWKLRLHTEHFSTNTIKSARPDGYPKHYTSNSRSKSPDPTKNSPSTLTEK